MCGIIGYIGEAGTPEILDKGLQILSLRGPDNTARYIHKTVSLGHTRLSIIDTSSGAHQPFQSGNIIIVFNGEIYNYKTLREELIKKGHVFRTTSDTEVLVESYREWGDECVKYLDGMWAFCIYDTTKNTLFLSRDRIGEKPLIYSNSPSGFCFASEIPALLTLVQKGQIKPSIQALSQFGLYNFRHIPAPYTAYENVFKLEPGYSLVYDISSKTLSKKKYFSIEKVEVSGNPIDVCEEFLKKAIEQTCYAEVPVGILLSGGVDSSLVAAMMKERNIMTYSLGWDENDEEILRADAIAKHLGVQNKKIYFKGYMQKYSLIELIKKNISHYGEPVNLFQIIYSNILLEEMKKDGIKVVVGGNGADELFYGYDGMNTLTAISDVKYILDNLGLTQLLKLSKRTRNLGEENTKIKQKLYLDASEKRTYILPEYRKFLYKEAFSEYSQEIPSKKLVDIFSWLGLRIENEHSITLVADLSGGMQGMEIRTPFLNKEIISFACNLDRKYKIRSYFNKRENKYILKKVLSRYLPEELVYKKKMGFGYGVRFDAIIRDNEEEVRYYFDNVLPQIPLYNHEEVRKMFEEELSGIKKYTTQLTDILIVCMWWQQIH